MDVIKYPLLLRFTVFTFVQALLTVIIALIIGVPVGFTLARTETYQSNMLKALITAPFLFPPLALLLGFVILLEGGGKINQYLGLSWFSPFSFWGIIIIHSLYNIGVIARISESAFLSEPEEYHEVARTLGATQGKRFFSITIPHIRPSIEAASLLVFLYAFNSFAIVLILGEVRLQTLEVMLYYQSSVRLQLERAVIIAIFQLIVNSLIIALYTKRKSYRVTEFQGSIRNKINSRIIPTIFVTCVLVIVWSPILIIFENVFTESITQPNALRDIAFSAKYNQVLGTSSMRIVINTLFFAFFTAVFTLIFSLILIYLHEVVPKSEKWISFFTILPMATSAVTLSFGTLLLYSRSITFNEQIWLFILAAHIIASLPFAGSMIFAAWKRIPRDQILVSTTLGASKLYTFRRVLFTHIKPTLLVVTIFSVAISIGEFGATFFLSRGEWVTISLAINRLFSTRNIFLPNLYSGLLITISISLFWLIEKFGSLELKL